METNLSPESLEAIFIEYSSLKSTKIKQMTLNEQNLHFVYTLFHSILHIVSHETLNVKN